MEERVVKGRLFKNTVENALPIKAYQSSFQDNILYTSYTKGQLGAMIEASNFSQLSLVQQQKTKELHKAMRDSELLVMILE